MSKISAYERNGNWWDHRSTLEKLLICGGVIALIVILVLIILLSVHVNKKDIQPNINNACLGEAMPIVQRIDHEADPCEDFYKFSCGNVLKNARDPLARLGPFFASQARAKKQIANIYGEDVGTEDHKVVRSAKRFYRACMNESAIERSNLTKIKEVFRILGGWPVLAGSRWNETRFSWIATSSKLRKLGYFYESFFNVTVEDDPVIENKHIFKISLPIVKTINNNLLDKEEVMAKIAMAFGADEESALNEMGETYDFILDIQKQSRFLRTSDQYQRITIAEMQNQYVFINWLELINGIVGPAVRVFRDDVVLFPSTPDVTKWCNIILNTSKRILANYILWKVVEERLPYLPVFKKYLNYEKQDSRSEFCMKQITNRFHPNPLEVMYVRKYFPVNRKLHAEEVVKDLKLEFLQMLRNASWMDRAEKQIAMKKVFEMKEIIGAPGHFYEEEVLDDLDIDMNETSNADFLSLLSQITRNYESWKYNMIYSTKNDIKLAQWNLQTLSAIGDYFYNENIISIPATLLQGDLFDESRPKYLNYGSMGTVIAHHFLQVFGESVRIFDTDGNVFNGWSNGTKKFFENKAECFAKQLKVFNTKNSNDMYMTDLILLQSLGLRLSLGAYQKWGENSNKEYNGDYTPNQLFWISASSYFCQSADPLSFRGFEEQQLFANLVSGSLLNIPEFADDFDCPAGSKMNPVSKCEIF